MLFFFLGLIRSCFFICSANKIEVSPHGESMTQGCPLAACVRLLASALETNCCLRRLELEHVTPKKLKKDEAYRSAMKKIDSRT